MILLATLLAVTSSLAVILAYKVRQLQKERDRLLHETKEDSKVLFLKSRYASMGETVGNIAHQWKQPLNAIGTIQNSIKAALIFQGEISKDKLLNSVETSFKLLRHLAETIDTFYSFLAQKGDEKTSFDLTGEMEKVRKVTEYSFENSHITLNFEFEINPTIQGNANEFTHAILNLILNAKDAFDGVSIHAPVINVNISGTEENCRITVADNAGGIRLNPAETVFDLHITTKENGSGLGLFMTKNIIENRFGGSISVENKNGGACFTITLPYAEYGEHYADTPPPNEKETLERINQLSHKIIELEEVEKTLKRWADIFKHAHWGISVHLGADNSFEMTNDAFNVLYGYSTKELKNLSVSDLFAPESLPLLLEIQKKACEKGYLVFEAVHVRKNGSSFPASIELIVIKDEEGEILYHIANIWDLTEKKAAEEQLLLKKFALDHIKDAVFLIDENANFQYVNEGACKTLGYSFEEFEKMNVGDIDPDWPRERWSEHCKILKEVRSMTMELRHRRQNGTLFPVEVSANCIEFGGKAYNMAIARDITERKAAEKELLLLNKALNNTSEASYILMNERIIQVNDGACRMLGYTREELNSMTLFDFDKEVTMEDLKSIRNSAIAANSSIRFERKHTSKEGKILNVEIDTNLFEYDGITYWFAIVRDITEQKKGREELLLKEFALNTVNEAVFLIDKDSMFHYVNEAACTALGYSKDELVSMGVTDLDPNFPIEHWKSHWEDIKEQKTTLTLTQHRRKDGTLFPIEISSNYFEYNGIGYSLAVSRDITERLQLEEQKDNERMRLFFERQLVGMAITSPEYGWIQTNEKLQEMLGYSHDELCPLTWIEMTHPDDLAADMKQFGKLLRGEIEDYMLEKRFIRKDGNIVYTNLAVSCVRKDDRSVNYVLALLEDITERKAAEKALLEKTDALKKALEFNEGIIGAIPDLLFEIAPDGTYVGVWAQDEAMLAAQKEILLGKKFQEILPSDVAVTSFQAMKEVDEKGVSLGKTYCLDLPEGKRWFELSVSKKKMSGNYIALSRDITERKVIEKQLKQSETGLKEAQKIAKIGSWELELPSQKLRWSDETYRIFEISKEDDSPLHKIFYESVHPEDREMVNKVYEKSLKSKLPFEMVHRIVMDDGRIKHVLESCETQYDAQGNPTLSIGTVQDITERKAAEEAIQNLNATLEKRVIERTAQLEEAVMTLHKEITRHIETARQLKLVDTAVNSSNEAIYINDHNLSILYVNDGACRMLGYTYEELTSMKICDIDANYSAEQIFELRDHTVGDNQAFFETRHRTKEGTVLDVEIVGNPFVYNGMGAIVSVVKDISERKKGSPETSKNRILTSMEKLPS